MAPAKHHETCRFLSSPAAPFDNDPTPRSRGTSQAIVRHCPGRCHYVRRRTNRTHDQDRAAAVLQVLHLADDPPTAVLAVAIRTTPSPLCPRRGSFHVGPNLAAGEGKMAKEYKVTVDQSLKAENNPVVLEKKMQELGREGWELKQVTS